MIWNCNILDFITFYSPSSSSVSSQQVESSVEIEL